MKTFDEFRADFVRIVPTNDARALRAFADDVRELGTVHAEALSAHAVGIACCITGPYTEAVECLIAARDLYSEVGDQRSAANTTSSIGTVYAQMGRYPEAMESYRSALDLQEGLGNTEGIAVAIENIGSLLFQTGEYAEAIEYLTRSLHMFEELGDPLRTASLLNGLGIVSYTMSEYPAALEYYRRSLAIYEEIDNRAGIGTITGNIGSVYYDTGSYPEALDHMQRALAVHREEGNREFIATVTGNIGNVYRATGSYPQALEYYEQALEQMIELNYRSGEAQAHLSMADAYRENGQLESSIVSMKDAVSIFSEIGDQHGLSLAMGSLVRLYLENAEPEKAEEILDRQGSAERHTPSVRLTYLMNRAHLNELRGHLDDANESLEHALRIAKDVGHKEREAECRQHLRELAHKRNDFSAYIEHNAEHTKIKEQIRGKEATQRLAMMEAERKIETELRERDKVRSLLYGTLPESVASRMIKGEDVSGDHYDNASVLFLDIVGFTTISDRIPPGHVVHLLKAIFRVCDEACKQHGLTKIKTIGDSYMAVAFPEIGDQRTETDHAERASGAALEMLKGLNELELTMDPSLGDTSWTREVGEIQVRIGLHCGPVVAGIVGDERLQYDVWGDTVNIASRMESTGEPGRIQCSEAFARILSPNPSHLRERGATPRHPEERSDEGPLFTTVERGEVNIKGKGRMTTYWLEGAS